MHATKSACEPALNGLAGPLRRLDELPEQRYAGQDEGDQPGLTMARGAYAIDPEPFGAPYVGPSAPAPDAPANIRVPGGPRDAFVLHPEDTTGLLPHPNPRRPVGCCGPDGMNGSNRICSCDAEVATLAADCWTYQELRLDPERVRTEP
ncbi:hypothetical protein P3T27_006916 [Kitasatospora sp. MAA19]|uniref:hypothetical protein n=1 Tax=unclassified Kitasatospora TaxID=2633591 RepID=UPI00247482C3|nr:hypothetical protein [Kitasatospora sp. MAA19]MDH6710167.1 hypothetical protein [Kitasatospora sp. MAA19]